MKFRTELEFQKWIADLARENGWKVQCNPDARKSTQFSTPGFPDLILARSGWLLFIECKMPSKTIRKEQKEWLLLLGSYSEADIFVWEPKDVDEIKNVITNWKNAK